MKLLGISFKQAMDTPLKVVLRHLDYSDIEQKVENMKANKQNA